MYVLRIVFTILSALCLAALLPAGTFGGMPYFLAFACGAGLFFVLMLLCKSIQKKKEPEESSTDSSNPTQSNNEEEK